MKRIKKTGLKILFICMLFTVCSCSSLKLTDEMRSDIDLYIQAVKKSVSKTSGNIKVVSLIDDTALEFKSTESVIDFKYTVENGNVVYNRTDTLNGTENARYASDGTSVKSYDFTSDSWVDKSEENKSFLSPETNPLISLSLFRIDSKYKVDSKYLSDIKSYNKDGLTAVEFTLKDSTVSDILGFYKAKGIVRQSAGHIRTYYIDSEGFIKKISVATIQKIISNGEEGFYKTEMTVICE